MKILVTGTSGRFGPYVLRELESNGHDLVLFDRLKPDEAFSKWPFIQGELTEYDDCEKAVRGGFDAVMHLGAQPWPTDHPRQQERRAKTDLPINHIIHVNVLGTYNMLHNAMLAGIKKFVMTSTNCVAGIIFRITDTDYPMKRIPLNEDQPPDIEDSYSFTKAVDEQMLELYSRVYGMRTYGIRCAGLCDEEARKGFVENAKPTTEWNTGMWGWVAREDAAVAHRLVLEEADELPMHDTFLCVADDTFVKEPSRELVEKFHPSYLPLIDGPFEGRASFFDTSKLKNAVGWKPRITSGL
jgi:UDP-glucose 4-epimerase